MQADGPALAAVQAVAARIFSTRVDRTVTRVMEGISTWVYRVTRGAEIFYLRVLPEAGASFVSEAAVHRLLRERGVNVPEIVYVTPYEIMLERSVMVTTAIAGDALGHRPAPANLREILIEAGHDLAQINQIPVAGFGWVKRDEPALFPLQAEYLTYRAFVAAYLDADLAILREHLLQADEIAAIRAILDRHDGWLASDHAWLAHGDFDVPHIYYEKGRYTGIIDFGEIRGAPRWYDLGHFALHDGETLPALVLPWLLEGYHIVTPLPEDYERQIRFTALLIGIHSLARALVKNPRSAHRHHCLHAIRREIALLRT